MKKKSNTKTAKKTIVSAGVKAARTRAINDAKNPKAAAARFSRAAKKAAATRRKNAQ